MSDEEVRGQGASSAPSSAPSSPAPSSPAPSPAPGGAAPGDAAPELARRTARGTTILAGAHLLARLPERPLVAAAESLGELWYRAAPGRAAQARANLGRVCEGLAAQGRGPALARRAATDPEALERIVRATFRHAARYYLEVLRVGRMDAAATLARLDVETPDAVRDSLGSGRPVILVGMHYGAIEVPTVVVRAMVGHDVTAPMELVEDPGLRRWFVESRRRVGVNIVPIADARRSLLRAIRRGESVGMVADRDMLHSGIAVPFFGHPAPIPAGPALLAIETGTPVYVGAARRTRDLRYRGRLAEVPMPPDGPLRQRLTALTASIAREFESLLADGPEQWWGAFHPIWPDLVTGGPAAAGPASGPEAPA